MQTITKEAATLLPLKTIILKEQTSPDNKFERWSNDRRCRHFGACSFAD